MYIFGLCTGIFSFQVSHCACVKPPCLNVYVSQREMSKSEKPPDVFHFEHHSAEVYAGRVSAYLCGVTPCRQSN